MSLHTNLSSPAALFAQHAKEPQEGLGGAILADPQQTLPLGVDLIDQRQVLVAALPLHLVHADRLDPLQVAVCQTPRHRMFYRAKHVLPRRAKGLGHPFPGKALCPAGQKPAIGRRQRMLAVAPGNLLHLHATSRAFDPTHRVDKVDGDPPQRDVLEPTLGQAVVPRRSLAAARTSCPAVGPRLDRNLDGGLGLGIGPSRFLVHERLVPLDMIEDSFQLHGWGPPAG